MFTLVLIDSISLTHQDVRNEQQKGRAAARPFTLGGLAPPWRQQAIGPVTPA
jgi:hypothetical protein